jgi:hypothetical protein
VGGFLRYGHVPALESVEQVLCMQLQFFEAYFFELLVIGEVRFPDQFVQPLSVAMVFGVKAIYLFAQRIVNFFHGPSFEFIELLHIAPRRESPQAGRAGESYQGLWNSSEPARQARRHDA